MIHAESGGWSVEESRIRGDVSVRSPPPGGGSDCRWSANDSSGGASSDGEPASPTWLGDILGNADCQESETSMIWLLARV